MDKKKSIKIKFSGMSGNFEPENNFIVNILRTRYEIVLSDDPEYLFFSVNSRDYLNYKCVRIYYTPENIVPDFNICDYAIGFSWLQFGDRYLRYPLYMVESFAAYKGDNYGFDLERALHKHEYADEEIRAKTGFCAFVYSNAEAAGCRAKLLNALSCYKKVDSGGRYLNNIGGLIENKYDFQRKYKFVIAFENTSASGYTTEKIVHAFSAGSVPIYWGDPEIEMEFNSGSFINCHRFALTEQGDDVAIARIIDFVTSIDKDYDSYRKMLCTPAFAKNNDVEVQRENLRRFLFTIFDQPFELAYRRNRFYWGERYERKQRIGNGFYWICRKAIPIRDFLHRR